MVDGLWKDLHADTAVQNLLTAKHRDRERVRAMGADLDELDTLSTDLVAWMETGGESRACRDGVVLAPLLRSLAELEQSSSGGRVGVDVRVPQDVSITVDQRQFQRAFENVMRNACRYAQALIVVDVVVAQDTVAIEVRDDGPGIPPEQRMRVLELFVRVESGATRAHSRPRARLGDRATHR